uniref:Magnesium transporter CorA-like family protein n=1 Tax=Kalanchoe fedtschenkoi TaxID=63787 RepID=A0A7N0RGJ7_KALFE
MGSADDHASSVNKKSKEEKENHKNVPGADLWTNGLICAFEFVHGHKRSMAQVNSKSDIQAARDAWRKNDVPSPSRRFDGNDFSHSSAAFGPDVDMVENYMDDHANDAARHHARRTVYGGCWKAIGWGRISELVQTVRVEDNWDSKPLELIEDENDVAVADVAAPYWQRPVGPTWWCHVAAGHPYVNAWLANAQWLHPAVSVALRDESKLISERMKFLLYEVPVRVAGGLLFELLGQSAGDPYIEEDDIPIVLRSWQAQNFLITALHVKGSGSNINVLGIAEVQELLAGGGINIPRSAHDVIALLACRLARWDDRLFRKFIFGAADELELMFMNRRTHEDMHLFPVILNQEIRRLSTQVIRVKWSLHAREEIIFELTQHMKGSAARSVLDMIRKSTRQMIEEQEAVRGRLFTIQDVMQSTVRAWLQDKSLRVTHNLGVFGGCGLVLSILTGLFGINVDGIPGAANAPYAFALFSGILLLLGLLLIGVGLIYLGLKKPVMEEEVEVRKLELQELVRIFEHEAESHAQVRKSSSRTNLSPTAADLLPNGAGYVLIA